MLFLYILLGIILILVLFFLWAIAPNKKRDVSKFSHKSYAHRGLHDDEVPENSLWAFKLARENGFGVELDVQMTKDGQLVVFHDGNLKRMCGKDAFLRDFTFEELQQFRLKDTDEKIPLFKDVLEVLGDVNLICEIKADNGNSNYEICEKTYNMLMTYKGNFVMESFSPFLVQWFRKNHPEIIRGQLSCNFFRDKGAGLNGPLSFMMSHLLVNMFSRPDFIAYKHQDTDTFGYRVCAKLYRPFLVAWTARGPREQESAWGKFDSVIFEKIER